MRWDELMIEVEEERTLPGYRDAATVRRFDAPEALDTRFYEVRAKSALNRVPEMSQVPFRWTINPYRGCSHACVYCVRGDTPILMADGSESAIEDLAVGDEVYGTVDEGAFRRLHVTEVLAHWSTVKPAYAVILDDGTELAASAEHRFLTAAGWRQVAAAPGSPWLAPPLARTDELIATASLVGRPAEAGGGTAVRPRAKHAIRSIEPLREELPLYDITTGTGDFIANGVVSHNCFARPTHKFLDMSPGRDFEKEIVVKVNVPEVLRRELARPSWKGEHVALGTNTDPYQWVEGRYRLMPGIWEAFRDFRNPCSILTKSPLLLRDLPLMKEIAEVAPITANLSVPTLDEKAWRATEPHTPHPRKRLEAVAELNRAGIPCGVLIAPLMPGINDAPEQVEPLLQLASEAGATHVGGIALHLRGEVRDIFFDWLRAHRPDLIPRYESLYARGAYAPPRERERLSKLVGQSTTERRRYLRDRVNLRRVEEPPARERKEVAEEQASLF